MTSTTWRKAAAEATADGSAALTDIGRVIIYLPRTLAAAEHDFVAALAASAGVDIIVGLTGDAGVDDPLREAWDELGAVEEIDGSLTPPVGTAIVAVSDPEEEVRESVRQINGLLLADTPLHRMAVLYRHASPYGLLAAEQMQAANLPWNGPSTQQLGQTLAGRNAARFSGAARTAFSARSRRWLAQQCTRARHGQRGPDPVASLGDARSRRRRRGRH